uniref:Ion_trans domain-containing protein n=2 Tax=Caenorhabditis tropicalis TaxID=1561998 RepID=A0A1I7U8M8_9PELO
MPAFAYHLFIAVLNAITSLIAIGELFSEGSISHRDSIMAKIVLVICPTIFLLQIFGFYVIAKLRTYIQCKRRHVRNGEPPVSLFRLHPFYLMDFQRIREVIMMSNKVSIMELSFENFNETMYSPA